MMDNDDTIRNLLHYGDEESENTTKQEEDHSTENDVDEKDTDDNVKDTDDNLKDIEPEAEESLEGETKKIEIPQQISSMDNTENEDENEEYFSSASEPDKDEKISNIDNDEYFYDNTEEKNTMPKKKKIIILALSAIGIFILMTVFSMIDTGMVGNYKKNFSANLIKLFDNMGIDISKKTLPTVGPITDTSSISEDSVVGDTNQEQTKVKATPSATEPPEYNTEVEFSALVPFESASESDFMVYKKGIVCAKTNYLCYINSSGETEWEIATSVVDPIIKAEGDYILIAQQGGTKLCLYNGNKLLYDTDTDGNILSCSVSSNGDVVVVVNRKSYKGAFSVYNNDGNEIYSWSSGSRLILSADIAASSRRVAVSLLDTESTVKSSILLFNINKEDSYAYAEFDDTILFDVVFIDNTVNAFGDNAMVGMNTSGKVLYDKRFDDVDLINYSMDTTGTKVMVFNSENIPMMNIYNSSGVLKYTITTQSQADYVDIDSYNIIYNDNRDVFLGKPNSSNISKFTASMDIKKLILLDSKSFVIVYSNSLEFVEM